MKTYTRPLVTKVELRIEEAVLTACKTAAYVVTSAANQYSVYCNFPSADNPIFGCQEAGS